MAFSMSTVLMMAGTLPVHLSGLRSPDHATFEDQRAGFKSAVVETAKNCSRSLLKLEERATGTFP